MNMIREFVDKTDFLAKRYLQVNSCGIESVSFFKHDHSILRSRGRTDYHFLYIHRGWIDAEVGWEKVRLHAGKCAVFLPGVRQKYTLSAEGDPESYFIHFTGTAAAEAMAFVEPRPDMTYNIIDRTVFEGLYHQLMRIHNMQKPMYIIEENGILLQLIALVARSSVPKAQRGRTDIQLAAAYIREHFHEDINLQECAEKLYLSHSRFTHLFTESVGISPHRYILSLRMDRARELLLHSSMNVGEVSESVGFDNPLYFSRLFRRYIGLSPTEFRKENADDIR